MTPPQCLVGSSYVYGPNHSAFPLVWDIKSDVGVEDQQKTEKGQPLYTNGWDASKYVVAAHKPNSGKIVCTATVVIDPPEVFHDKYVDSYPKLSPADKMLLNQPNENTATLTQENRSLKAELESANTRVEVWRKYGEDVSKELQDSWKLQDESQALNSQIREKCSDAASSEDCKHLLDQTLKLDQRMANRAVISPPVESDKHLHPIFGAVAAGAGGGTSSLIGLASPSTAIIKVFYVTERQFTAGALPTFADQRAKDGALTFGIASVSIPPHHVRGEIENPVWWKFEFARNPKKHFTLSLSSVSQQEFYRAVRDHLEYCGQKQVFVFVHGYYVSFDDAVLRTAQIAADIGFDGAPMMYDWPSRATAEDYVADKTSMNDSVESLASFLQNLASATGATTVNVIAHSMGNYGVLSALDSLFKTNSVPTLGQLVLAAPDIDVVRIRQIVPHLAEARKIGRITLYASQHDLPLKASAKVNGVLPAGATPPPLVIAGVDTIDASTVEGSFLGHDYFATTRPVLADIWTLFNGGGSPPRFGMDKVQTAEGAYWRISKTAY